MDPRNISVRQWLKAFQTETKSATHCLTKLFLIYQNKHWTKQRDDRSVDPSYHIKIVRFQVYYVCCSAQPAQKSVQQSRQQVPRGFCPNMYTTCAFITVKK